ncbi:phosphotransferase [Streptomyces phyllanthi]|uniref:phosphotransferase n=1 Tax=Streptomyces phyllanthi TaxID=1803180 RepID=UPI001883E584|nr:phosphotransferase [Streptomyces phyllanthi]
MPRESDASIVHGDFRVDNTILDPSDLSRVRAVVDWELSTLGDPLADLGTFLACRPAVDALLDSPAATDPGFPGQLELAEQYALLSGRDITLLPFCQALAYCRSLSSRKVCTLVTCRMSRLARVSQERARLSPSC